MTTPFTMVARAGTHVCCYLYPAYASYKAINLPDDHPEALEQVVRWLMYWGVVGTWTAIEGVVGWMFSWLPFYSIVKFGFFLWLALPQTQGSTYIYRTQLAPIFEEHEPDVDAFLQSLSGRATVALSNGAAWLWEKFRQQIGGVAPVNGQDAAPPGYDLHQQYPAGMQQPPSLQDPASGAAQQLYGFVSKYAGQYVPVAIAALSSAANATRNQQNPAPPRAQRSVSGSSIAAQVPETIAMPIPHPNREPSDPNLRSRTYLHAQNAQNAQGSSSYPSGVSSSRSSRNFTAPSGGASLSQRSSQESVQTRSSGLEGRRDTGSFEQIQRDEIAGLPEGEARPEIGKRRSSWFSGWGTPERQKAE